VVCLSATGELRGEIEALGIPVFAMGMSRGPGAVAQLPRLLRCIRSLQPDIVQTWMYHGDLLGGLATRLGSRAQVVWGLHNSSLDPRHTRLLTRLIARANAALSHVVPARIVSCSQSAADLHVRLGYDGARFVVIPNGFDTEAFRPDAIQRTAVRRELNLPESAMLIGTMARFDPQKDHRNLIAAIAIAAAQRTDLHLVLAGKGCDLRNTELRAWIEQAGLEQRCHLLGLRRDIPRLTAALDLGVTASAYGEAFPLAVGEAMSCGVPCVVTDVGDAALMVGETGRVVPPGDAPALGGAITELLRLQPAARSTLGRAARERIITRYSLPTIAGRYRALYETIQETRSG
jgi:glycosyltransferase involved in cell wall biosynthesis